MDWRDYIAASMRGEVRPDVPLAPRTSMRVGGAAALLARPADVADLQAALRAAREAGQPAWVLGGGANTIVGDGGVGGLTLQLPPDLAEEPGAPAERVEELGDGRVRLELSAGAPAARFMKLVRAHGLVGAEFAAGIPGTVGGLVAMNAGTPRGEMKDCVEAALLCDERGAQWVPASELAFAYRHAELGGRTVARARLVLRRGAPDEVARGVAAMEADLERRRRSQPLQLPNCGSVFRNPPGSFAGRLVEEAGLKGRRVGNAQISDVHANFIVNLGGASAADVTTLMAQAQQAVAARAGIVLALEVRLVGFFAPSPEALGLLLHPGSSRDASIQG